VGHDWGAVVAWGLAGRVPDRVRTLTALSVPHPRAFAAALARSGQLLHSWYMAAFQLPALPERALAARRGQLLGHLLRRDGLDAASAARIAARAADPAAMRGPISWYRALGRSVRALPGSVAVPTLMVWGDRDHYVSRAAVSGAARYVVGPYRLEVLIGASHWLPTTAVDRLAPLVLDHLRAH
jgi:pimeloyl-ACP methyl ester carboxylesterase